MEVGKTTPGSAYRYTRYMRDGSVKEFTAVIRSRRPKGTKKKEKNHDNQG